MRREEGRYQTKERRGSTGDIAKMLKKKKKRGEGETRKRRNGFLGVVQLFEDR